MAAIRTSNQPGTPSPPIDRSNSGPVTNTASTISTACTMKPAVEVRTPELAATAGGRPCFWKNRMLRVGVARGAADEAGEGVGELDGGDGPEGEPGRHRAEHGHGLGELGQLPDDEREQHPAPDRVLEDVAHGGHTRQLTDEEVDAEREGGGHEDPLEREAVQLGRLGRLDARQRRLRPPGGRRAASSARSRGAWPPRSARPARGSPAARRSRRRSDPAGPPRDARS